MKANLIATFHGWSCTKYHLFCLCQSEISFSEKKKSLVESEMYNNDPWNNKQKMYN
jgi:hypothetical protein